jgi:hypothetical protein
MVTLHSTTSRAYCPPSWHDPSVASPGGQAADALAPRCLGRMRQCIDSRLTALRGLHAPAHRMGAGRTRSKYHPSRLPWAGRKANQGRAIVDYIAK